ncbi:putative purine/cytosine permease [Streptomyces subrutilus]|uniref:Nitrate reductase n=1 Tax=Streptomyces subrutilus TaxID=36818 RepID=A0A5P2UG81_9ACTN|nr:cytosine permease [Streptomyces subrutilus]QEU77465.1 nitrate reductase [Streptomyces subrutilus]GGZ47675.1 putative purine/cytosine permease [Streptomyces subrutilus]
MQRSPAGPDTAAAAPGRDRAGSVESRGIDVVPDEERHGTARELFFLWAAPNVSYLSFVVGGTLVLTGLSLAEVMGVIVGGNLFWLLTGFIAVSGPAAGTSGSVISRAMYGVVGNKFVVAVTGWLIASLYLALNWSAASTAGLGLAARLGVPPSAALDATVVCLIAGATVLVAVFGHATIVRLYGVLTVFLTVVFVALSVLVVAHTDWSYAPAEPLTGSAHLVVLASGLTLVASAPLSYANSPDLARYLPRHTSGRAVMLWTAAGGFLPSVVFTAVGALAATTLDMSDPQTALEGVMPAWFVPAFVAAVVVNTVANNGITAYSSGLSMQSIGVRLPRTTAVLVIGVIGTAMTLFALLVFDFLTAVNATMELVVVVTGPCMAVYATDIVLRRNRYDGRQLHDASRTGPFRYRGGVNWAGVLATLSGVGAATLCAASASWAGPVSSAMGGLNLAVPVGVLGSAVLYWSLMRAFDAALPSTTVRH